MTGYRLGVGPVAQELLRRVHESTMSMVAVKDYREMRAARKLAARGWLVQLGTLPFFTLAETGQCEASVGVPRCPVDGQCCSTCRIGMGNGYGGQCEREAKS